MTYLSLLTVLGIIISFIVDRNKTIMAFKIAARMFLNILPAFLIMLVFISIVLFLLPDEVISTYLGGDNKFVSLLFASAVGSITIMPGFVAFPLCRILLEKGVLYMVLSAFTTTLMMVGVLSYPIEKQYFGVKVTIIRNIISFLIALAVAIMTGLFFGEII
jgi:uncharacterized membrane protein YraQ (UPF0718 family)